MNLEDLRVDEIQQLPKVLTPIRSDPERGSAEIEREKKLNKKTYSRRKAERKWSWMTEGIMSK